MPLLKVAIKELAIDDVSSIGVLGVGDIPETTSRSDEAKHVQKLSMKVLTTKRVLN